MATKGCQPREHRGYWRRASQEIRPHPINVNVSDAGEALAYIQGYQQSGGQMVLSIVHHATFRYRTENVGRETHRLQQSPINPLLDPLQILQGVVDWTRLWSVASLKRAGWLCECKRAVARVCGFRNLRKLSGRNPKNVAQSLWALDFEFLD